MGLVSSFILVSFLSVLSLVATNLKCRDPDEWYGINMAIRMRKNTTGQWITSFSTTKDIQNTTNGVDLDLSYKVETYGSKKMVYVFGSIKEIEVPEDDSGNVNSTSNNGNQNNKLFFHPKTGKSIILTNGRRTAHRENPGKECCYGGVFSHRPLYDDELFEVEVNEIMTGWSGSSLNLAVTTLSPEKVDFPSWSGSLKSIWLMEYSSFYINGQLNKNFGFDLRNLKKGDRVGIMRKGNGNLHFSYNGVDQGVATQGVPPGVYGLVEIRGYVLQVSLVDR